VDTAVSNEPPLAGGWVGWAADVLAGEPPYSAVAGHGTFVTGLVRSLAPGCVVKVRKVLDPVTGEADAWTVAQQIVELGRAGLDVLNLSMVCFTENDQPPVALASAIDRLDADIVVGRRRRQPR
jgi:membrane-anchored mycosin MYCP